MSGLEFNLLNALPHGVISMSYDIPDLVETSSNLATVKIDNGEMVIHVSNRSSVDSAIGGIHKLWASNYRGYAADIRG